MSTDQNTAGVPRQVEELSAGEKAGRTHAPSDQGSRLTDARHEVYTHGYSPGVEAYMAARTASQQAGFFLPHLRVGMHVLDCGCGPGSTTLDFATAIAPGQVEGVDIEPSQIAAARARAVERRLTNVHFQVGTIYALPFAADSFDGVFAHTVLQHVSDPLRALREMRRVLKPDGIIGLRDDDWGTFLFEPSTPLLRLWESLHIKVWTHNGGNPFVGRTHRRLLKEAGFVRPQGSSSSEYYGLLKGTAGIAAVLVEHHRTPAFVKVVVEQGWADQCVLDSMYTEVLNWGERDDAFFSFTYCEAIGWKPEALRQNSG
jgi:ubiquinone/menaquinone biosynthesis C-methylase UbiE